MRRDDTKPNFQKQLARSSYVFNHWEVSIPKTGEKHRDSRHPKLMKERIRDKRQNGTMREERESSRQ